MRHAVIIDAVRCAKIAHDGSHTTRVLGRRETEQRVATRDRRRGDAGARHGRAQRSLPLWQRQEIQMVLPADPCRDRQDLRGAG